jgi:hypothetical protein
MGHALVKSAMPSSASFGARLEILLQRVHFLQYSPFTSESETVSGVEWGGGAEVEVCQNWRGVERFSLCCSF